MNKIQKRILQEIVKEQRKDKKVIGVLLFGSLARGTEHASSDIDIEIIHAGERYQTKKEIKCGVPIDYELTPIHQLLKRLEKTPYLTYPYLGEKILYDRTGELRTIKNTIQKHFAKNRNTLIFWQQWEKKYLKAKKQGKKIISVETFYSLLKKKFG